MLFKAWEPLFFYAKDCKLPIRIFKAYRIGKGYGIQFPISFISRGITDKNIEDVELFELKEYLLEASKAKTFRAKSGRMFIRSLLGPQ